MELLLKPIAYICIFFGMALLKTLGFFKAGESKTISKIYMNFILPSVVVVSFASNPMADTSLFLLIPFALLYGLIPILIVYAFTRKLNKADRAFYMINVSGINIGGFGIPMVQCFLGPAAIIPTCIMDVGNAIMMSGGAYTITATLLHTDENADESGLKKQVLNICRRLFSNVALDVYLLMLVLLILHIHVPESVGTFLSPLSNASAFLSMAMLGTMFEFKADWTFLKSIFKLIGAKLVFCAAGMAFVSFCMPFGWEIKKTAMIVLCCPIGALAPIYTDMCHANGSKASCANSLFILISFCLMTVLSLVLP
ncbi:MAG: hypothetical protein HFG80_05700 [Eubacterium sp.]|nr:hypothetical protein [Eubacterium sp.]